MEKRIRQPIVAVLGHIDHGKTSFLDRIRGTTVAAGEPGAITQHVGCSIVPLDAVKKMSNTEGKNITIPGLLFIDTPGHESFTTLRERGSNLADLAVLVVDVNQGLQKQTYESINLLKKFKTPFIVAANKIDAIHGWISKKNSPFKETFASQQDSVKEDLDGKIYDMITRFAEKCLDTERFDRITDFTKQIAIVPISAKTGEGISDVLLMLLGLSQNFLKEQLTTVEGPGLGSVLEIKDYKGLGTTADIILYNGTLREGDTIALGGENGAILTKIKAILKPAPMQEISEEKKFISVKEVYAADGVKIAAPDLDKVFGGSALRVVEKGKEEEIKKLIEDEIKNTKIETEAEGIIIKADTLGSLEAIVSELRKKGIHIQKADIGGVQKHDLAAAAGVAEKNPELGVIFAFNVPFQPGENIFGGKVIYSLIENYEKWVSEKREKKKSEMLETVVRPGKIIILPHMTFRESKPAVVGIEVKGGIIKSGCDLMKNGHNVGKIKEIQDNGVVVKEVKVGQRVAISIEGPTMGRQIEENDILYTRIPKHHFEVLEKYSQFLLDSEKEVLEEIKEML